ncbi:MAG: sensor histidine kinase, partial [Flavobacteriaceae bacterium]|nr:sensor histidine kinase [Flavobacteriaceae bacterium]
MIENLKHKNKYGRTTTLALNVFYTLSLSTFLFSLFCYFQIGIRGVIFKALLSYSILNTINILFFYLHNKILKSYVIASVLGYITLLFVCSHSGGVNSPAISFLVLIIFFGYLIEKKYGNIWLATVLVTVIVFYLMNKYSFEMINEINEENITEFNLLFLLFLIVLLGGVFGMMMNKTNERIKRAKKEIVKRNDEKTIMLKEIHHRVKNNLQVVNSL